MANRKNCWKQIRHTQTADAYVQRALKFMDQTFDHDAERFIDAVRAVGNVSHFLVNDQRTDAAVRLGELVVDPEGITMNLVMEFHTDDEDFQKRVESTILDMLDLYRTPLWANVHALRCSDLIKIMVSNVREDYSVTQIPLAPYQDMRQAWGEMGVHIPSGTMCSGVDNAAQVTGMNGLTMTPSKVGPHYDVTYDTGTCEFKGHGVHDEDNDHIEISMRSIHNQVKCDMTIQGWNPGTGDHGDVHMTVHAEGKKDLEYLDEALDLMDAGWTVNSVGMDQVVMYLFGADAMDETGKTSLMSMRNAKQHLPFLSKDQVRVDGGNVFTTMMILGCEVETQWFPQFARHSLRFPQGMITRSNLDLDYMDEKLYALTRTDPDHPKLYVRMNGDEPLYRIYSIDDYREVKFMQDNYVQIQNAPMLKMWCAANTNFTTGKFDKAEEGLLYNLLYRAGKKAQEFGQGQWEVDYQSNQLRPVAGHLWLYWLDSDNVEQSYPFSFWALRQWMWGAYAKSDDEVESMPYPPNPEWVFLGQV